jgi:electron transport complex protein RnfB
VGEGIGVVIDAILILGGVGLVFGILIALANAKLKVYEDPRIGVVTQILPGANCGACGLPGCRAFAEKAVEGSIEIAQCSVATEESRQQIAGYLGVEAGVAVKRVARLLCAGGTNVASQRAEYRGVETCGAAATVAGGGKGCVWGCLGLADCERSCDFGAIAMNAHGLPVVEPEACTACGDCVEACPKELFTILPMAQSLLVQCKNLLVGDAVIEECQVACTACGKCVQDAAPGLISIESGVAVVNQELAGLADLRAVSRCPTSAIVWLSGAQFARVPASVTAEAA